MIRALILSIRDNVSRNGCVTATVVTILDDCHRNPAMT